MAVTVHQLWSLGLLRELEREKEKCKECRRKPCDPGLQPIIKLEGPAISGIEHNFIKESRRKSCDPGLHPVSKPEGPAMSGIKRNFIKESLHGPSLAFDDDHQRREWTGTPASKAPQKTGKKTVLCCNEGSTFVALLRTCAKKKDLYRGSLVHDDIVNRGLLANCSDALITMYARCDELSKAQELLDVHKSRNVSSWTALISAYARHGQGQQALSCFEHMQREGLSADAMTFACILKACGSIKALEKGEQIHDLIATQGLLENDSVLANAVFHMYVKCGALAKAQRVIEGLPFQDVASWTALISGYTQRGHHQQALSTFERMQHNGLSPDALTYSFVLKACGNLKALDNGKRVHDEIARKGFLVRDNMLGHALMDMYVKCGALAKAHQTLEELPSRDLVTWNALIGGYAQHGEGQQVFFFFDLMQREGLNPDAVTYTYILKACGIIGMCDRGEKIHDVIARQGLLENDILLGTALVDMYGKCGALAKAQKAFEGLPFRDAVSWSALIAGYSQHGQGEQALKCFEQMQYEGFSPDVVTFSCILNACGSIEAANKGAQIHEIIVKEGLLSKNVYLSNALVDMYAKCGDITKAQDVFNKLPSRDVITWTALIEGYVQQGQGEKALHSFEQMQQEGLSPNAVTLACVLKACSTMGAFDKGEQIHNEIVKQGWLQSNVVLGTAVVDMYVKCGALAKAQQVLEELPFRDAIHWNALITGYAKEGKGEHALKCFKRMEQESLSPDAVTFSSILKVCSHLGLVEDGHTYFVSMSRKYGIKPHLEHYATMVDLFGRSGHLDKAVGVIEEMQASDDSPVWNALLGACQKWGNVSVGRWAFEQAVVQDKTDSAAYILMANIHAAAGVQGDAEIIKAMRMINKAWKDQGWCWWVNKSSSTQNSVEDTHTNSVYENF